MTSEQPRRLVLYSEGEVGEELPYESQREEDLREGECSAVSWELGHLAYGVVWARMLGKLGVRVKREQQECCPSPCVVVEGRQDASVLLQPPQYHRTWTKRTKVITHC